MKIQPRQIEQFLKNPDPAVRAILVYGPDRGLVQERIRTLARHVVEDFNDPFNVSVLSGTTVAEDEARLDDEARAISMMGGARLVRIEDADEKIATAIKNYLKGPADQTLVLIEAGELTTRSNLRKTFESGKNCAALPCYVEDERDLATLIRGIFSDSGFRIAPDAVAYLAANLQGDRRRVRNEIDKLMLYMGADKSIDLETAQACCGEAGESSIDTLVYSVGERNAEAALGALGILIEEGVPFIVVLRALQTHFRRLHLVKSVISEGGSVDEAMARLQPPVFFKFQQPFKGQASRWTLDTLETILRRLGDVEAQCKRTGTPVETLCAQTVLGLSRMPY